MDERTLDRIRKLLARAEGEAAAGHEEAAETYNERAAELISKHGIDDAMLAASDGRSDPIESRTVDIDKPYATDKSTLLAAVGNELGVRVVAQRYGRTIVSCILFGHRSDIERVELLYTSLLLQVASQIGRVRPDHWSRDDTAAYRRTWLYGFTRAVMQRLQRTQRQAATERGTGTELVLRDRSAAVDEAFETEYGDLGKPRKRRLSGTGMRDGYNAGQRANLHHQAVGDGGNRTIRGGRRA